MVALLRFRAEEPEWCAAGTEGQEVNTGALVKWGALHAVQAHGFLED